MGIEADKDFVETVMDSREAALELVQENNTLMLNDTFKDELDLLIPGIKRELNGIEADDTDLVDEDTRHTLQVIQMNLRMTLLKMIILRINYQQKALTLRALKEKKIIIMQSSIFVKKSTMMTMNVKLLKSQMKILTKMTSVISQKCTITIMVKK